MAASDVEIWTAKPLPDSAWPTPNNVIVSIRNGRGIAALAGNHHDGDCVSVSRDQDLLAYMDLTQSHVNSVDFDWYTDFAALLVKEREKELQAAGRTGRTPWEENRVEQFFAEKPGTANEGKL